MELNLKGKTAIVCGAGQGIGKAIAVHFAELGATVAVLARNMDKLLEVKEELSSVSNLNHTAIALDLDKSDLVVKAAEDILQTYKRVHILVNNSGGPKPGKIIDSMESQFITAFGSHILSSHILMRNFLPGMIDEGFGRILNIVSIGMKEPIENLGVSNTIRGAMGSWAKTLAREVAPYGITVNNLLPGHTLTPRLEALFENRSKNEGLSVTEIKAKMLADIPAGRFGKPEDLAFIAGFLASDKAGFITGASIPVDGGWLHGF